ncbi:hypothetical protein VCHC17A1_3945B, partial [Vibrio cholerae HC-17A1]
LKVVNAKSEYQVSVMVILKLSS